MSAIPSIRIRSGNESPINGKGDFVVYWTTAHRRTTWNFGLERAAEWARELDRPLVVVETLHCGHRWASDRMHRFALDGMADTAQRLKASPALYYPYVETGPGEAHQLLQALGGRACVAVTDDFPTAFVPTLVAEVATRFPVALETVDSNGLLPLRAADRVFTTAHSFRRFLQKTLPHHLDELPQANPLARAQLRPLRGLPGEISRRWPKASARLLRGEASALARLPIDHSVAPAPTEGGARAAQRILKRFLTKRLARYPEARNHPDEERTSGLSPYLHFGHISAHDVFAQLMRLEGWSPGSLSRQAKGSREGWWGASKGAEAFLDQLITWREVGYNMCAHGTGYEKWESLPAWARVTLERHARDRRLETYTRGELESARTSDALWNAAQRQLLREGRLHNYLRMLWGKKIVEWSPSPQAALQVMVELNNRWALDGQNPNSYSGIFWVLGRYDRPWGPERPIFGKVRYMSSQNTARKVRVKNYIRKYAP